MTTINSPALPTTTPAHADIFDHPAVTRDYARTLPCDDVQVIAAALRAEGSVQTAEHWLSTHASLAHEHNTTDEVPCTIETPRSQPSPWADDRPEATGPYAGMTTTIPRGDDQDTARARANRFRDRINELNNRAAHGWTLVSTLQVDNEDAVTVHDTFTVAQHPN